jgi:uncharacterized membrane protein HdeD (DUF308 family)
MPTSVPSPERSARDAALSSVLAQNWWAVALRGAFAILFGLLTFVMPGVTLATLVIVFAAYMFVDGIFAIVSGVRAAQRGGRWGLLILEGAANILAAVVALVWPVITVLVFVYLIAAWSIVSGAFMAVAAFRLHQTHGRWLMAIAGVFSIIFGVLVALSPIAGALVLTLWLGAYALVFGVMLVALGFKLRSHRFGPTAPSAVGSETGAATPPASEAGTPQTRSKPNVSPPGGAGPSNSGPSVSPS